MTDTTDNLSQNPEETKVNTQQKRKNYRNYGCLFLLCHVLLQLAVLLIGIIAVPLGYLALGASLYCFHKSTPLMKPLKKIVYSIIFLVVYYRLLYFGLILLYAFVMR